MKFRKKPVVIDAVQWTGDNWDDVDRFANREALHVLRSVTGLKMQTLEGVMLAGPGDWIIRGVKGEFYPCKPDIFAATYEPADETTVVRIPKIEVPCTDPDRWVDEVCARLKAKDEAAGG
jgi:hypothetical protein